VDSPQVTARADNAAARATPTSSSRIRALDGLRGFAVVAVVLYHLDVSWMTGGFLGVSVFFTLSGFVITRLLVAEHAATGRVDLAEFYRRRIRRLWPSSLLTVVAVGVALVATGKWNPSMRGDVLAIVAQIANWRQAFSGQGYGAMFGPESPFTHFWSLAIEEQFYLVFPLLMVVALGRRAHHGQSLTRTRRLVGLLIVVSLVAGQVGPFSGRYFRTDVRAAELLAGCLLALFEPHISRAVLWLRDAGPLAVITLAVLFPYVTTQTSSLHSVVLPLCTVLSVIIIASATMRGSPLARALGIRPLVAIGNISYAVYLVHWPIIVLVRGTTTRVGLIALAALALHHAANHDRLRRRLSVRAAVASTAAVAVLAVSLSNPTVAAAKDPLVERPLPQPTLPVPVPITLSISVIGDSTGDYLAQSLALLPGVTVHNHSLQGCPMLLDDSLAVQLDPNGPYETWQSHGKSPHTCSWETNLAAVPPADVLLVMFGPTMMANYRLGGTDTNVTQPAGSQFIFDSVLATQTRIADRAPRTVWITTPVSKPPAGAPTTWFWADPQRAAAWNAIQRSAANQTGTEVLDFADWLLDQPSPETFRPDGTHLRGDNAVKAAAWVLERLRR
jgi:peptidoglycan/LPS O-acetylase OafA/YrhL